MCCNVFNVWPKTTLLLPVWSRDAKSLDTPAVEDETERKLVKRRGVRILTQNMAK